MKKKFSRKMIKKLRIFVLFLFLSVCLMQAEMPELSLSLQSFLFVILVLAWLFTGLYLLGMIGKKGRKNGKQQQEEEDGFY